MRCLERCCVEWPCSSALRYQLGVPFPAGDSCRLLSGVHTSIPFPSDRPGEPGSSTELDSVNGELSQRRGGCVRCVESPCSWHSANRRAVVTPRGDVELRVTEIHLPYCSILVDLRSDEITR